MVWAINIVLKENAVAKSVKLSDAISIVGMTVTDGVESVISVERDEEFGLIANLETGGPVGLASNKLYVENNLWYFIRLDDSIQPAEVKYCGESIKYKVLKNLIKQAKGIRIPKSTRVLDKVIKFCNDLQSGKVKNAKKKNTARDLRSK